MRAIILLGVTILVTIGFLNRNSLFRKTLITLTNNQVSIEPDTNDILTANELKDKFGNIGLGKH